MTPARKQQTPPQNSRAARKQRPAPQTSQAQDSVTVLIWLRARKGKEAGLERELRALVGPSRAEPGCLAYSLHRSADQPRDFFMHEVWASQADLARHWGMPHFQQWVERQSAVLESRQRFLRE